MSRPASLDAATRSIDTLQPLASLLDDRGHDLDAWLQRVGLVRADLDDADKRISVAQSNTLSEAALDLCGDPALGLRVVERIGPENMNLFTYLAATSANGREAFERATRYVAIAGSDFEFSLEREGDKTVCRTETGTTGGRVGRFSAEIQVGMMVKLGRLVAGDLRGGNEAWFAHAAPSYADQYEPVLQVPVRFGMRCNALIGRAETLEDPLPKSDSMLCDLLDQHAREIFERLPRVDSFAQRVRDTIIRELSSGDPGVDHVALVLGISSRTLRRRLKEESTTHRELLDDARNELACRYLASGTLSVTEVAFLLGFSDASAFHKAFRRWTGDSPGDWMRKQS